MELESCECVLCKRIFGLPRNYITVYPYRFAILKEFSENMELFYSSDDENRSKKNTELDEFDEDEEEDELNTSALKTVTK